MPWQQHALFLGERSSRGDVATVSGTISKAQGIGITLPSKFNIAMTYEEAIALTSSGNPLSKKQIWAITDLGYAYYYGKHGHKRDTHKGVELYRISANLGDSIAEYNLGLAHDDGVGVEEIDWDEAAYWYERAARKGDAFAMHNLASLYKFGLIGLEKDEPRDEKNDLKQAVYWLRKAAKKRDMLSIGHLGECYFYGSGVRRNRPLGFKLIQEAAEAGVCDAQYELSQLYSNGDFVEKDDEKEFYWLQKAAAQGHTYAQNDLGVCYSVGRGTPIDHDKAIELYKRAARKKDDTAAFNLGECYEKGEGVKSNPKEALRWYRLSKRWGNEDVDKAIERMKRTVAGK